MQQSDLTKLPPPLNEDIFSLAFDLLTCPREDAALKEELTARFHALKVNDLREFYLMTFFITCSLNVKEKALQYIHKAFKPLSQGEDISNTRRATPCPQ